MPYETFTAASGFVLPSAHSWPPFFTKQRHQATLADQTRQWITLILAYARYRKIWILRAEDAGSKDGDWSEVFWNPRIRRQMKSPYLEDLLGTMVEEGSAFYDPPKQTRSVLLCRQKVEEWARMLHDWVGLTGQFNTILTYYEILNPPVENAFTDIPLPLLMRAIGVLTKSGMAQTIDAADGGGVRFFNVVAK